MTAFTRDDAAAAGWTIESRRPTLWIGRGRFANLYASSEEELLGMIAARTRSERPRDAAKRGNRSGIPKRELVS